MKWSGRVAVLCDFFCNNLLPFFHAPDEIKFGVSRLVKPDESEDEDNNNTYHSKPISCDSPVSNLSVTRSRSRSRSRSSRRSRSRSSSSELEVDSPPPPPRIDSPVEETKKLNGFSMSALLRDDQPKIKSPTSSFAPLR